ncbi:dephospho-CoA kinase [Omnitrophica bacterium]|nr:dephospho-CoA kinase [Candidatus Omnitrophota bacterium]
MKRPFIIGVTGGLGTGKSTVARIFGALGAKIVDADRIAHEVMLPGKAVYKKVISIFGADILRKDRKIDRKRLGKIIFSDKKKRQILNSLIHPEVIKEIGVLINKRRSSGRIHIIDVPLLIESGLLDVVDRLIVVTAQRKTQIKRCMKKWDLKRIDVEKRIRSQMPLKRKRQLADFIIDNNGSFHSTKKEVEKIWRKIKDGRKI